MNIKETNPCILTHGYSQWIVTRVVELKSALVHTTAQNHRPIQAQDCTPNNNVQKQVHKYLLFGVYLSSIEATEAAK